MKKFNLTEQNYIKLLNSTHSHGRNFKNIFDNDLKKTLLTINRNKKTATFKFELKGDTPDDEETDWMLDSIFELQYKIVTLTNLLDYLEKNGLITSYISVPSVDDEITFGQGAADAVAVNYSFADPIIIELVIKYLDKNLIPSIELRELEEHNFKSVDERKFSKEQCASWTAIIVSIFLGLWGIFWNVLDKSNDELKTEVVREINSTNKSITKYLDKLHDGLVKKDSLKVMIVSNKRKLVKKNTMHDQLTKMSN